jgi:phosphoserine / homoserine phosphotransferase
MPIACIDLEGVLIPELWPHIAYQTGIEELHITTREEPNYSKLVEQRIHLLKYHQLRLCDVRNLVSTIKPLPGAVKFIQTIALHWRIVLVSDAFRQMVEPIWMQLDSPELQCHEFSCDSDGYICTAEYSRKFGKHEVVENFKAQGEQTLAIGDAFNDLSMLRAADKGFLFRPSLPTRSAATDLMIVEDYQSILHALSSSTLEIAY